MGRSLATTAAGAQPVPWDVPGSAGQGEAEEARSNDPLTSLSLGSSAGPHGQGGPPPQPPGRGQLTQPPQALSLRGFPALPGAADAAESADAAGGMGKARRPWEEAAMKRGALYWMPSWKNPDIPLISRLPADDADLRPAPAFPALPSLAALLEYGPDWPRVGALPAFREVLAAALTGDGRHPLLVARRIASLAMSGLLGSPAEARAALRPAWDRVQRNLEQAMQLAPPALQKAFHIECSKLTTLDPSLQLHRLKVSKK